MQQGRDDRFHAQPDLLDDDLGYCNRMQEVWLAGAAPYPLMCLLGQEKCPFYEILSIDFNITYDIVVRTKQITIDLLRKTTLFHCYGKCFEINSLCFIKKN